MQEEITKRAAGGSTQAASTEEELRAEIERLKRQIEERRISGQSTAPSRHTIRNLTFLVVIVLIVGFVVGYIPRQRRQLQLTAEADTRNESLPRVSVISAQRGDSRGTLILPGNIQAVTEAPILARAEGFIKQRYVDIGDHVAAGQLLADIEAPDLDQQVRQARAAMEQAQADLERSMAALEQGKANESIAKVTAERWQNLVRRGVVSKQENDQYQAQYQAQAANVRALERALAASKSNLGSAEANRARLLELQGYLKVKAPFAGVVTLRNVDVGTLVNAGSTLLFRIAQTNLLRTYVNVPQSSAADVHVGQSAALSITESPHTKFAGRVTRTANALDPASRTLLTEIQVPNPQGRLLAGMYVQVDLNLPREDPPLLIASDTLVVRPEGTLVALVGTGNVVHFQRVTVGRDFGDRMEILSGLTEGERAIVNPNDSVQEGVKVSPIAGTDSGAKRPAR